MNMNKSALTSATTILLVSLFTSTTVQAAKSWGVTGEEIARFQGKVVDIACELAGDCPADCGAGMRQLGVLKSDGVLVMTSKNQTPFSGTADDLVEFCGQEVEVDGLFTENRGVKFFAVQFVRPVGGEWQRTNRFTGKWAERNGFDPGAKEAKQWFRNDPRVKEIIERDGFLGLGLDADAEFIKSRQ